MRRYYISYLRNDGAIWQIEQRAPATPVFEAAFSAFAHGTLLATPNGPIAVQDLAPGMALTTREEEAATILWIGALTLLPRNTESTTLHGRLFRIMPDAFGMGRPAGNLLTGPGARLLTRPHALRDTMTLEPMLTPCSDLVDGLNVIDVAPPRPVTVYHVMLARHGILIADGLETESFHPGPGFERTMDEQNRSLFMALFPHIRKPEDFGPMICPRLPLQGV